MPRYELRDGSSSKFWQIDLKGSSFTTTYGKIGSAGQSKTKSFTSASIAQANHDKLVTQKAKKGYIAVDGNKTAPEKSTAAKKKTASSHTKKKVVAKKGKAPTQEPAASEGWMRYEYKDGVSDKFWEVTFDEESFSTRHGRIGSGGKVTTKPVENAGQAKAAAEKAAAKKVSGGYWHVGGSFPEIAGPSVARNSKLEAMIRKDIDGVDSYLAYADWLQEQGNPRGELIVVQHALAERPKDKKLQKAEKQLLTDYKEHLWTPMDSSLVAEVTENVKWSMGYITTAKLKNTYDLYDKINYGELLGQFIASPSCQFLQDLTLGIASMEDNGYTEAIRVLAESKRPTIKRLFVGDFHSEETELNWSHVGFVEPLCKALPNLEELTLRSGGGSGTYVFPKLRSFTVICGDLGVTELASIANAKWPKLETLSVQLGNEIDHQKAFKAMQPILDAKGLRNVRHLGFGNFGGTDALCELLVNSKIAKQIEELDLSLGTMGDAGAAVLVADANRFPNLKKIDVSENFLSRAGVKSLAGLAEIVEASNQEDDGGDPDDRYISAYE